MTDPTTPPAKHGRLITALAVASAVLVGIVAIGAAVTDDEDPVAGRANDNDDRTGHDDDEYLDQHDNDDDRDGGSERRRASPVHVSCPRDHDADGRIDVADHGLSQHDQGPLPRQRRRLHDAHDHDRTLLRIATG